ncbi:hypothetical protein [Streptomyces sp. NPDC002490]|uniref:hypothetical protein n=1 Tax=Streptomyces sp. NPDC002490 TaxID=3154416 RepID=UPI00332E7B5C
MERQALRSASSRTGKSHVAAVLAKTGARDRTQAVIAAYEGGFVGAEGTDPPPGGWGRAADGTGRHPRY